MTSAKGSVASELRLSYQSKEVKYECHFSIFRLNENTFYRPKRIPTKLNLITNKSLGTRFPKLWLSSIKKKSGVKGWGGGGGIKPSCIYVRQFSIGTGIILFGYYVYVLSLCLLDLQSMREVIPTVDYLYERK